MARIWHLLFLTTLHRITSGQQNCKVNVGFIFDNSSEMVTRAVDHAIAIVDAIDVKNAVKIAAVKRTADIRDCYDVSSVICSQLSEMTFALIGMTNINSYEVMQAYSNAMQVPFLASMGYRRCTEKRFRYDLLMNPSYVPAVLDFVEHHKWKRLFYLYNSDEGLWKLHDIYDRMASNKQYKFQLVTRRIPDFNESYNILHDLDKLGDMCAERVFFLDMDSRENTTRLLKQIVDVGMNREGYHYIIGSLEVDTYEFGMFHHGGVNITGFRLVHKDGKFYENFSNKWIIKDNDKEPNPPPTLMVEGALTADAVAFLTTTLQIIKNSSETNSSIFRTRRCEFYNSFQEHGIKMKCDPFQPSVRGPKLIQALKQTTIEGLTGHVSFDEYGHRTNYTLFVHTLGYKTPLHMIGQWSTRDGLQIPERPPKPTPPSHTKHIIITAVVDNKPYVMYKENKTGKDNGEKYEGFLIDMLKLIQEIVKFNYTIIPRPSNDSSFGSQIKDENGNTSGWNGMIGQLVNGYADLALAPMTILKDRQEVISITKPFMKTGLTIMIKRPEKRKPGMFSFKDPLATEVWICILLGFLSVSVIIFLIGRFSPYEWSENSEEGPSDEFSFLNSLWSSLGALMQQGTEIFPKSLSGRCAESAWWFFTLILISSYTANLAAYLTVEGLDLPIDSVDQLSKQTEIKYGIIKGGSSEEFFAGSKYPVYKTMWDDMINLYDVNVNTGEEGWQKVTKSKGKYAFITESASNDYFNQRKPCTTMKVGGFINHLNYGIATRRGLEINQELNLAVLEIVERGDVIKLRNKWWLQKGQCGDTSSEKSKTQPMSLSNVSGMFHILIGGLVIAMVTAVMEYVIHGKIKQKQKYSLKKMEARKNKRDNNSIETHEVRMLESPGEWAPLRPKSNGEAQDNKGYQTTGPANLITLNGTDNSHPGTLI